MLKTAATEVADRLRARILGGEIRPGTHLLQDEEAERLGVSRTPVREAFRQLEAEGLVQIIPHRGVVVTRLSIREIRDIYLIRRQLEPLAAAMAAEKASEDAIVALGALLEELKSTSYAEDRARLLSLNKRFHFMIYEASGIARLVEVISSLWSPIQAARSAYVADPLAVRSATKEHSSLYEAIRTRSTDMAAHITSVHLGHTEAALLQRVSQLQDHADSDSDRTDGLGYPRNARARASYSDRADP